MAQALVQSKEALQSMAGGPRAPRRPRLNALQKVQIATAEFRAWFANSKLIHPDGRPRVVYHGAIDPRFSVFTPNRWEYIYATADRRYAAKFARDGAIYPLYLSIQNPLDLTCFSERNITPKEFKKFLVRSGFDPADLNLWADANTAWAFIRTPYFDWAVRAAGFDGIAMMENRGRSLAYAVFKPTQLKSAIGNSGAFSSKNEDICDRPPMRSRSQAR